ncbi:MAG: lysophospholipid acyltransferase family protein [Candidatus Omnitrophota bacterium]
MIYQIFRIIFLVLSKIFFRLKVINKNKIPRTGALIIASNHTSFLDPVLLGVASPRPFNFMAREDLFSSNRFFGRLLQSINAFPLRREGSALGAFKEALKRLQQEKALVIFPEGTRSKNGALGKAHSGIGLLALKSRSPVIPAYIDGSGKALPRNACFIKCEPITVYFGEPISTTSFAELESQENYQRFADLIMERITQLKKLHAKT